MFTAYFCKLLKNFSRYEQMKKLCVVRIVSSPFGVPMYGSLPTRKCCLRYTSQYIVTTPGFCFAQWSQCLDCFTLQGLGRKKFRPAVTFCCNLTLQQKVTAWLIHTYARRRADKTNLRDQLGFLKATKARRLKIWY